MKKNCHAPMPESLQRFARAHGIHPEGGLSALSDDDLERLFRLYLDEVGDLVRDEHKRRTNVSNRPH